MKLKDSDEIKKEKKSRKFIISDSYDEMKFIDDWISYAEMFKNDKRESRFDESRPFTDSCIPDMPSHFKVDEDSSYSSVMDLYMNNPEKYNVQSSEDEQSKSTSCMSSVIDMCDQPNLAIMPYSSEEETKIHLIRVEPKLLEEEENKQKMKIIIKSTSEEPEVSSKNKFKINTVEHPVVLNLETSKKNVCSKKIKLNSHKIIMQESKPDLLSVTVEESESTEPIKTFDLLREAEKRTVQPNKRNIYDVPLRRFVIETEESTILMKDVFKLYDLKTKSILGELFKRGTNGYYQKNWFMLRENFFSCFNGKKNLISATAVPQERLGDIEHPEDPLSFLTKKYTIDLVNSRILLCKKKGKKDIFTCFSESIPAEIDLVDVTNVVITNIQEMVYGYKVCLQKENQRAEITLSCLNFCIKNNDGYRFYKPDSIDDFLKWIIAFRFRLGQIELNIG